MTTATPEVTNSDQAPLAGVDWEQGSFRDPDNRIFYRDGNVFRTLTTDGLTAWQQLSETKFFPEHVINGTIVATELVTDYVPNNAAAVLKHEAIPCISYPYEWSFSMLKDAALLQLDLLIAALNENLTLKDGSAYNLQFRGVSPTFIDIGSFRPLKNGEPWIGYRQFCSQMLFPLMLQGYKRTPFQPWLRGSLEGITPQEMSGLVSFRDWFRKGIFGHVVAHSALQQKFDGRATAEVTEELRKSGFKRELILANARKMQKIIRKLLWNTATDGWTTYRGNNTYADSEADEKSEFVRRACETTPDGLVWDLGCNDGKFARIAAESARYVIALDFDHGTIDNLYRELREDNVTNILPLTSNLVDPSPGLGWNGCERKTLAQRGKPDIVLALALIHHVVITGHIPMRSLLQWLRSLDAKLVIEFVNEDDPMVKRLMAAKSDSHHEYSLDLFEREIAELFTVEETLSFDTRKLYSCKPY